MKRPRFLRAAHRRLGLAFSLFVFLAAGSGLLHNVMTWTQAPPPAPVPPGAPDWSRVVLTPAQAMEAAAVDPAGVSAVSVRSVGGEPCYQCLRGVEPPVYLRTDDGRVVPDGDIRHAAEIASRHLGGVEVRHASYLTAFDSEYIAIFRLLPVHRFDADDGRGTRVYVSTVTGSVARHTDDRRQFEADVFSYAHKFAFIRDKKTRDIVLTSTTAGIALAALSGIVLFGLPFRRKGGGTRGGGSPEAD